MSNQIVVPSLGESVTEATVSKWRKQVGERVDTDEPIVELETDKVNVEVPSPLSGTLSSIQVKEGDTVEVGAVLGLVNESKSDLAEKSEEVKTAKEEQLYKLSKTKRQKEKPIISQDKEPLKLDEEIEEKNSNGALILNTLAEKCDKKIQTGIHYQPNH